MIFLNRNEERINPPIVLGYEKTDEINQPSKLKVKTTKGLTKGDRIIFGKEYIIVGVEEIRGRELTVEVYAEESILELDGKIILDNRPTSVLMALQAITAGTRWTIGQFPTVAGKQLFFYGVSAYKALMEVLKAYNLELDTEFVYLGRTITRKINLRTRIGEQRGRRTTIQTDAVEIGRIYQDDPVVTRLYGYGKGEELDSGGYGRRVDIKTVNGGLEYIQDESARMQFGIGKEKLHYEARLVYPDITDPAELKSAMQADFELLKVPKITYTGKIEDFGLYDDKLGDDITVLDEELGIAVKGRILKLVTTPRGKEIALGNLMPTLHSEHQRLVDVDKRTQDLDVLRNAIIGIDGKDYLDGVIDRLNSELSATAGFVQVIPGRGLVIPNAPTEAEATQVIEIGGGFFRVAESKDQNGNWIYRTFGTGKGFTADEIVAGILKGGQVLFNLEAGTFIIGNPASPSLIWDGSNLKIDGNSIELTGTDKISLKVSQTVADKLSDPAIQEQFKGDTGPEGPQGPQGIQGQTGPAGQSQWTHLRYSANSNGSGFVNVPDANTKYIGIAVTTSSVAPTTAGAYTWQKFVGENGQQGIQGVQGPAGEDGQPTYTWIKYGDSPTTGMSDNPAGKKYIGIAHNKTTDDESSVYSDYTWSLIQGPKGDTGERGYTPIKGVDYFDGVDGQDGKGITSAVVTYQNHTNGTTAPTGTWTTSPSPIKGQYLWTRTITTYTDTTSVTTYSVAYQAIDGTSGTDGRGIVSTVVEYVKSTTTTMPSTGWSTTRPTVNKGEYLWTRTTINYTSGSPSVSISNSYVPTDGQNGTSAYLWVRYSQNANGNPMGTSPADAKYIGVATTSTPTAPAGYASYSWSLIKGQDGVQGETGQDGQTSYLHIKYSNDGGTTFTSNNGETVGDWIGTYVDFTEADSTSVSSYTWNKVKGDKGDQGIQGPPGANGQPTYTWLKYADSPTTGMSDSPTGKKYIGLAVNKPTATESTAYADYTWSLIEGPQGSQGPAGANGQPTYTWVKYADTVTGTGMSDSPTGKRFIGLAFNKTTPTKSTNPGDYAWSPLYDNVKVGGRNYLRDSHLEKNTTRFYEQVIYDVAEPLIDKEVAFSFDMKTNTGGTLRNIRVYSYQKSGITIDDTMAYVKNTAFDTWERFSFVTTIKQYPVPQGYTLGGIAFYDLTGVNSYSLRNFKLEQGNVATDWTPAPEDVQDQIETITRKTIATDADVIISRENITQYFKKTVEIETNLGKQVFDLKSEQIRTENEIREEINALVPIVTEQGTAYALVKSFISEGADALGNPQIVMTREDTDKQFILNFETGVKIIDAGTETFVANDQQVKTTDLIVTRSIHHGNHVAQKYDEEFTIFNFAGGS